MLKLGFPLVLATFLQMKSAQATSHDKGRAYNKNLCRRRKHFMQRTVWAFAAPAAFLALSVAAVFGDDYDKKTDITISQAVQVPGAVLQPGKYVFILMNSSSDRHIVEVRSEDGKKLYTTFFATRATRLKPTGKVTLTFYEMPEGQPQAVRQWFWPGDLDGQEFLYPHKEAGAITQSTHKLVPEVSDQDFAKLKQRDTSNGAAEAASAANTDTNSNSAAAATSAESDRSPVAQQEELTKQSTSRNELAVQAPPPSDNVRTTNDLAQATPPPPRSSDITPEPAPAAPSANINNDAATLPQTASEAPLIGAMGLILLFTGLLLHFARKAA